MADFSGATQAILSGDAQRMQNDRQLLNTFQNIANMYAQGQERKQVRLDKKMEKAEKIKAAELKYANSEQGIYETIASGNKLTPQQEVAAQFHNKKRESELVFDDQGYQIPKSAPILDLGGQQPEQLPTQGAPEALPLETQAPVLQGVSLEGLSPKGRVEAERMAIKANFDKNLALRTKQEELPAVVSKAENMVGLIDTILSPEKRDMLEASVGGLFGLQGRQAQSMPLTENQRNFAPMMAQLKGKVFMEAYQELKGGGQITEVEGKKAEEAKARLDQAQTEESFIEALTDLRDVVSSGISRAKTGAGVSSQQPQQSGSIQAGTEKGGYRFKGGNPSSQENWELIK